MQSSLPLACCETDVSGALQVLGIKGVEGYDQLDNLREGKLRYVILGTSWYCLILVKTGGVLWIFLLLKV